MQNHLNKKQFISEDDHKKIINQFSVDPNSEEAQDLADLTRKNIEFLQEHYKGQNVEILPPKYQYFNKNKKGDVIPVNDVDDIKKAFQAKKEKTVFIKSKSNRSVEIGKDLLKKSEEMNRMSDPKFLRKNEMQKNLKLGGKNLTFNKSLKDLTNSKFNLSPNLLKKNMNFKSLSEVKKSNALHKPKKVEYQFVPHAKGLNFGIENNGNLPKMDQRILNSTLKQQNSEFFKEHKIKKGNYVDFKKIPEKDYLKSIEKNEQLQLIETENQSAIDITNKLIEEEIRKAMEGADYTPSKNIPSLITGSDDFNERMENLKNNDNLDVKKDIEMRKKKSVLQKKKLKVNNFEKNNYEEKNYEDFDLENDNFLEEDKKLQREMELMNLNFEREMELIEKQQQKRIQFLKSGDLRRENKENSLLETEKKYQKQFLAKNTEDENSYFLENRKKDEELRKKELEIESLRLTMMNNNKNLKAEIKKSEIYKKREREILNWKKNMIEQKKKLELQRRENKLREQQIKNLLLKKKSYKKNINSQKENLKLQIKYQKNINNLRKRRIKMENDLKKTNNLLMNNNKKLSTRDMKNFMDNIQKKISKIRKIKLEIKNYEKLLQKIYSLKKSNKINDGFGRSPFPEDLLLNNNNINISGGNGYLEDYPDVSVFDEDEYNNALLLPNFGK